MNFLNNALAIIKFITLGACTLAATGISAMQREQASWHTVPFELQLNIWAGAENNNFCAKSGHLNILRLVCTSWNSALRDARNLRIFFEHLFLKDFNEPQRRAVMNFLSFVLSDQNTNAEEKILLRRLYNHFKSGTKTLAQLANHFSHPLNVLAGRNADKAVLCLLTLGANKEAKDSFGLTPLHKASLTGHREIVRLLLDRGADKEIQNDDGLTALHIAANEGHLEIVKLLLAHSAHKEALDVLGLTPLHKATACGHLEIVRLLVTQGANKDAQDRGGWTPLHSAAFEGHVEIARLLLTQSANKDARDRNGWSSLHMAAQEGHLEVVKLLLSHNAHTAFRTDNKGRYKNMTAADIAQKQFLETQKDFFKAIFNRLQTHESAQ